MYNTIRIKKQGRWLNTILNKIAFWKQKNQFILLKNSHAMKKSNFPFLLIALVAIVTNFSCKKDSGSPSATTVEYQITPINYNFTKIIYTDNSGNSVTITDASQLADGKKAISVTSKPFQAKIETEHFNTNTTTFNYNLVISVDGQAKKVVSVSVPASATTTGVAEFTVQ